MFAKDDTFYHMVVLVLTCSSNIGIGKAYKVRDTREDLSENPGRSNFFGNTPVFPDYFGKSDDRGFEFSSEFGSSEPFLEPRNTHSLYEDPKPSWERNPHHGFDGSEEHHGKRPILSLYDNWSPEEEEDGSTKHGGRPNYSGYMGDGEGGASPKQPNRYAQQKANRPGPPYNSQIYPPPPGTSYKNTPNQPPARQQYSSLSSYKNPQDETLSKQQYKYDKPATPTMFSPSYRSSSPLRPNKDVTIHQHQFRINHEYVPPRGQEDNADTPSFRSVPSKSPSQQPKPSQNTFYDVGDNSWKGFQASPPDVWLNTYRSLHDSSKDFSNFAPNKKEIKRSLKPNSCVKTTKTSRMTAKSPLKWMNCFICVDEVTGRSYEQCSEDAEEKVRATKKPTGFRGKRSVPNTESRKKRQYEYDNDYEQQYGPDHHEYRFGPEHFIDEDAPVESSRDTSGEAPHEAETCWKKRKGEMLCIVCENMDNRGTYEQCAYGSDPMKNSYERSVSKVYGSPRLPNEQVKYGPETPRQEPPNHAPHQPRFAERWQTSRERHQHDNRNDYVRSNHPNNHYNNDYNSHPATPEPNKKGYGIGHNHRDVNKPNVFSNPSTSPNSPSSHFYGLPEHHHPKEKPFLDHEDPVRYQLGEHRKSSYGGVPFQNSYIDTFADVFPEINAGPVSPGLEYNGEYDEYDEYDGGEVEDGQGQFSANQQKHIDRPSSGYNGKGKKGDFIEKAIGDFSNKNRTSCIKVQKDKMTCFQCVDPRGSQKEECMYVAGNEPKTKQLSFREVKEFKYYPSNNNTNHSRDIPMRSQRPVPNRSKRKFKKYSEPGRNVYDAETAQSVRQEMRSVNSTSTTANTKSQAKNDSSGIGDDGKNANETDTETEETNLNSEANIVKSQSTYNPIPTEPPIFSEEVHDNTEHSDETELAFDPVLGLSLPRYMLEKSEHEAIFDEALASG